MLILEIHLNEENSGCNLKFHLDFFNYIYNTSQCKNILRILISRTQTHEHKKKKKKIIT